MGWFSSILGSSSSKVATPKDDPTYKKYAAEISNFELDPKLVKQSVSSKKSNVQLNQTQDTLDDIDSLNDVKKYFQEK